MRLNLSKARFRNGLCGARAPRRAFTLIELLAATGIFAALLAALYAALFGGVGLRETAWEDFESRAVREQVAMTLRRDLAGLVAPTGVLCGPLVGESAMLGGERGDTLEFHTTTGRLSDAAPSGDILFVEYFLEPPLDGDTRDGYDFVRRTRTHLTATVVEEEEIPEAQWRLLGGVAALAIAYYDGEYWLDTWDTTTVENENPRGIRIRMDFVVRDGDRPRSPLEIVCEISQHARPVPAPAAAATGGQTGGSGAGGGARP